MTKIKDTNVYPLKAFPTIKDFFIGTDAENGGKTVNFPFGAVSNMILGDIEYTFSMSSLPLLAPTGNGYFITNGVVDFASITTLQISKINLAGSDLTPLMNFIGGHLSEFTLRLVSKSNKNIFAYLKINTVVESVDYFTFNVSIAPGNNYLGQLVDKDIFTFNYDLNSSISTLPVASETTQGIVELATAAETIAGTDNTRAVHPLGLAAALALVQKNITLTTNNNSGASTLITNVLNVPRYDLYADSKIENAIVNGVLDKGSSQNAIYSALLLKVDKTQAINTAGPLQGGGSLSGNLNLSILQASASQNGYLSSTDWVIFNNKSNANGTVTQVFALTIGTSGTDVNSSVINATTTPNITLNIPTASATNRGVLSTADWINFNSKQSTSLLANNILVGNASNIATGVLMSGDANISTSGVVTNTGLYGFPITMATGFFKYNGTNWVFDNNSYLTGSGIAGQVSFWNGTGIQTGDNNLFWNNTTKVLGIGTTTPGVALDISGTTFAGSQLRSATVSNTDNAVLAFRRARASLTAVQTNDVLGSVAFRGHDGTSYGATVADIYSGATETFTPTARGSFVSIKVTPKGTITPIEPIQILGNGTFLTYDFANPVDVQPGFTAKVYGKGDNTTYKGVAAITGNAEDRSDISALNKGVLIGGNFSVKPLISRNNVPFDDVVGVMINNEGANFKGTDGLYFSKNALFSGSQWISTIASDANSDHGIVMNGTYAVSMLNLKNKFYVDKDGLTNIATLTASRAMVTDASKNLVSSATTAIELGYLNGVTSAIQSQLNGKLSTSGNESFTGVKSSTNTGATSINGLSLTNNGTSGTSSFVLINGSTGRGQTGQNNSTGIYSVMDNASSGIAYVINSATGSTGDLLQFRKNSVNTTVFDNNGLLTTPSPTFTGIPTAPTPAPGTNTTQLATTAFVTAAIGSGVVLTTTNQNIAGFKTFSDAIIFNTNTSSVNASDPSITRKGNMLALILNSNGGGQRYAMFDGSTITTTDKTFTFQNQSGTLALTNNPTSITALSFVKSGATSSDILTGDGTTVVAISNTNTSASTQTLSSSAIVNYYVFGGTTATWTLPTASSSTTKKLSLIHTGSGNVTVNTNGGTNTLYNGGTLVNTYTLMPAVNVELYSDGTKWIIL